MRRLRAFFMRLLGQITGRGREADFNAELESHLQLQIDDNLRAGMTPADARRHAILASGGIETAREAQRDRRGLPLLDVLGRDIRFAARQLRRAPGFTVAAVLVLALGIGANLTILAFVDAALLRPLPYPDASRLVDVTEGVADIPRSNLSYADYLDWKRMNTSFEAFDAYGSSGYMWVRPSGTQFLGGSRVTAGFFRTLGVGPFLGRDFQPEDARPGAAAVVILSHTTWQRHFGGRTDAIGEVVTLSGTPRQIVGVLSARFEFAPAGQVDVWAPIATLSNCEQRRSCHNLYGVARLKPGVTVAQARTEIAGVAATLEGLYPDSNRGQSGVVAPLSEVIVGNVRSTLFVLLGGVVLLLFIACLNVANLLLVRTDAREREFAVRRALGASRARLTSQFIVEALVLVVMAVTIGGVTAAVLVPALVRLIPEDAIARMPYLLSLSINLRLVAATVVIAGLSAIALAATPVLRTARAAGAGGALPEGTRGSSGRTWRRLGSRLVIAELVIAVVLLVGAGLLGRSAYRLMHADLAFEPDQLATIRVIGFGSSYTDIAKRRALDRDVQDAVARLPGVTSVSTTSVLPVSFNGNTTWIRVAGQPFHGEHNEVNQREVSASYFDTLGVRQVRGRRFTDADDEKHPAVAIINEALARKYFAGLDPIGQTIGDTDLSKDSLTEVVGVVADLREGGLDQDVWPAIYFPTAQQPNSGFSVVVRTAVPASSILPAVDAAIRAIGPTIGTLTPATMADRIDGSPAAYLHRSTAWLVATFAAVAWVLGIVGLYGVLAYLVSQRRREIGVRLALGAERSTVSALIVREAALMAAAGIAAGMAVAVAVATMMRAMLFNTAPWDGPTLAAAAAILAVSTLAASYLPARRAASVDPIEALRAE